MKKLTIAIFLALASLVSAAPSQELKYALNWLIAFEAKGKDNNDVWTSMLSKNLRKNAKLAIGIKSSWSAPIDQTYIYDVSEKSFSLADKATKTSAEVCSQQAKPNSWMVTIKKGSLDVNIWIRSAAGKLEVIEYQATIYD